jgi:hypothetical protein
MNIKVYKKGFLMGMAFTIKINYVLMKQYLILQPRNHKEKHTMVSNTHQTNKEE